MSNFYGNFNKINNDTNSKYTTKNQFDFNYSDYQKLKLAEQYNELYSKEYNVSIENNKIIENKKIYNLSINDLGKNISNTFSDLLNDIITYINQDKKTINQFFIIFTQKERLLYIGLLIIILAFCFWLIDISK